MRGRRASRRPRARDADGSWGILRRLPERQGLLALESEILDAEVHVALRDERDRGVADLVADLEAEAPGPGLLAEHRDAVPRRPGVRHDGDQHEVTHVRP